VVYKEGGSQVGADPFVRNSYYLKSQAYFKTQAFEIHNAEYVSTLSSNCCRLTFCRTMKFRNPASSFQSVIIAATLVFSRVNSDFVIYDSWSGEFIGTGWEGSVACGSDEQNCDCLMIESEAGKPLHGAAVHPLRFQKWCPLSEPIVVRIELSPDALHDWVHGTSIPVVGMLSHSESFFAEIAAFCKYGPKLYFQCIAEYSVRWCVLLCSWTFYGRVSVDRERFQRQEGAVGEREIIHNFELITQPTKGLR
jgi:hypothetical protein